MNIIGICQKSYMTWQDSIKLAGEYGMKHIEFNVDQLGHK